MCVFWITAVFVSFFPFFCGLERMACLVLHKACQNKLIDGMWLGDRQIALNSDWLHGWAYEKVPPPDDRLAFMANRHIKFCKRKEFIVVLVLFVFTFMCTIRNYLSRFFFKATLPWHVIISLGCVYTKWYAMTFMAFQIPSIALWWILRFSFFSVSVYCLKVCYRDQTSF